MSNVTIDKIVLDCKALLNGITDAQIQSELFNVCVEVARDVLAVSAPVYANANDTWLPTAQWAPNEHLLREGTLSRLYSIPRRPWTDAEQYKFHFERYVAAMGPARATSAGATPASEYARVLGILRMRLPGMRDEQIAAEIFNIATRIRVDALGLAALDIDDLTPANYFSAGEWPVVYLALIYGVLSEAQAQALMPWSAPDTARLNLVLYEREFRVLRGDTFSDAPATLYARLIANVRTQIPDARATVVDLEIFNTANKIRVDALGVVPLTDSDTAYSAWIPSGKWDESYQALLYGTLGALRLQTNQPWAAPEIGNALMGMFAAELALLRTDEQAAAATTVYQRVLSAVRVQLPGVRESAVKFALFGVCNTIRDEALGLAQLVDADIATPSTWLPSGNWDDCYNAALSGALAELQRQVGQAWSNPTVAELNAGIFQRELAGIRSDTQNTTATTVYQRVINAVRAQLPQARESDVKLALFGVCNTIRDEALGLAALLDADIASPSTAWLPAGNWDDCYNAALAGTLAEMQKQTGQPWASPAAEANYALFQRELAGIRSDTQHTAATTVYQRVINAVRAQLPQARESDVKLALFGVCNTIRDEALGLAQLLDADIASPSTWLPSGNWDDCYNAALAGTLAEMQKQTGQPWASPAAEANYALFQRELAGIRSDTQHTAATTVYQRVINAVRAQLPQARESDVKLALFGVCNTLRDEALLQAPLVDADIATPTTWLAAGDWDDYYNAAVYGTLAELQRQTGQPWSNPTVAELNAGLFQREIDALRTDEAVAPSTVYQRLLNAVRVQLPAVRESTIKLAMFAIADKIRLDALRLDPLASADTDPSTWIPTADWPDAYQAVLYGTLSRLQMQAGQPWANDKLATANQMLFLEELQLLRGEQAVAVTSPLTKLMDLARVRLPGSRDNILQLELFEVIDEFLRETNLWREEIEIDVVADETEYLIVPTGVATIVRLMWLLDENDFPVGCTMEVPGEIVLNTVPSSAATLTATVALSVSSPADRDGYPVVPEWILTHYSGALLDGLQGRMMSQIGKPYSNERMSVYHLRRFQGAIGQARVHGKRKNLYAAQVWRFPQTFATRRH